MLQLLLQENNILYRVLMIVDDNYFHLTYIFTTKRYYINSAIIIDIVPNSISRRLAL